MEELDEIRRDSRTAQLLREGQPGAALEQERARIRLNGGNPATGEALRSQPAPTRIDARLANPPSSVSTGDALRAQPAAEPARVDLKGSRFNSNVQYGTGQQRPVAPPAAAPAVAPRNVPLNNGRLYEPMKKIGGLARRVGPAAAGAGVVAGMGTYQIDDPTVDSSAGGTIRAVANGDLAGAGRSLSKGALEAGMDLGGSVAGAVDTVLPGQPATNAYQKMLKSQFGDQLQIADPAALRAAIGLEPVKLTPDAQRRVNAGETQRPAVAPATQTQRPLPSRSNVNTGSGPRTIAGVAEPQYELGKNAVEIIRGGERTVETFGPNGNEGAVPSEIFNVGQTAQYRATQAKAMQDDMADPRRNVAQQRVANEGEMAKQELHNRGSLAVANVRQEDKTPKPEMIKDVAGNVTGTVNWRPKQGGGWEADVQPVAAPQAKPKMSNDAIRKEALAKIKAGANIEEVNARLRGWGLEPLVMSK